MSRFIGFDVHSQSTTAVVLGASGRTLKQQVLETRVKVLADFLRSIARPRYLCMEEGNLCAWLYEELESLVDELVVVQPPRHVGTKSDARDAYARANELRLGAYAQRVYKAPRHFRELREAVQAHRIVQRDLQRVKNRIHAMARSRGLRDVATDLYDPNDRRAVLARLPSELGRKTKLWCDELDGLVDRVEEADDWLREAASRVPIVKRIATAPGIAELRAARIVATVVTPHRFRTKRQFWSYCGLGIVTRSSSDWLKGGNGWEKKLVHQTRGLNHNRHPVLKDAFKGAAHTVTKTMKEHLLKDHFVRLTENGTKPNLAQLTIARRIAAAVLAMWKNNEDYDPNKHRRR